MLAYKQFPVFTANQVLRHDHLNDLVNYLEEQGRQTRTQLGGIGIVSGFYISLGEAADGNGDQRTALQVSGGVGVTSRGYLANTEARTFTGAIPYTIEQEFSRLETDLRLDSARSRRLGMYEELTAVYEFFLEDPDANDLDLLELYELIPDIADDDQAVDLDADFLSDKVLLAYIKQDLQALKNCDVNDCNDKGARLESEVRFLLTTEADAERILARELAYQGQHRPIHEDRHARHQPPSLDNVSLRKLAVSSQFSTLAVLNQAYRNNVRNCLLTLKNAIKRTTQVYQYVLDPIYDPGIVNRIEMLVDEVLQLMETKAGSGVRSLQDFHDFAAHLLDAYREFGDRARAFEGLNQADPRLFPKHLMLGRLSGVDNDPLQGFVARSPAITTGQGFYPLLPLEHRFRHQFIPSQILDQWRDRQEELWSLHFRLLVMLETFQAYQRGEDVNDIRLTPSQSKLYPLSERAIPAYLPIAQAGADDRLLRLWNYRKSVEGRLPLVYSYHRVAGGNNPLRFRQDKEDFYRIEGHLGHSLEQVSTAVFQQRQELGLDFGIEVVRIDDMPAQGEFRLRLSDFSQLHPGLEHQGGVPKGGTFIIVYQEIKGQEIVAADFALPYNTSSRTTQAYVLQQCVYKWISSSKYLMNLTRPKYGIPITQRDYTLRVSTYEIDGVPLVGRRGRTIRIPIRDIKYRGMVAIVEGLNKAFPTGLIFDTASGRDYIAIKKYAGQTFRFVVQDTANNDQYLFDQTGRSIINSRKGSFYKAASCSLLAPNYDPNDYRRLHFSLPKNDDYSFRPLKNTDWMGWNTVTKDRVIVAVDDERLNLVRPYLEDIVAKVAEISPDAKVYLAGSWLDGSWATTDELQSEAEIITLRETLLGKSGSSDIDLVVELPQDQQVLNKAIEEKVSGHYGAFRTNITFGSVKNNKEGLEIKRQ